MKTPTHQQQLLRQIGEVKEVIAESTSSIGNCRVQIDLLQQRIKTQKEYVTLQEGLLAGLNKELQKSVKHRPAK